MHKVINACRCDMEWTRRDNNLQFFPLTNGMAHLKEFAPFEGKS